ncbi:MAG: hypothetical protein AB4426_34780 [Xenococcaceae cyanobacterium]
MSNPSKSIKVAIAWCLAWREKHQPEFDLKVLQQMRQALLGGTEIPEETPSLVAQVQKLQDIDKLISIVGLHQLETEQITLGGGRSRGLGVVRLEIDQMNWLDVI